MASPLSNKNVPDLPNAQPPAAQPASPSPLDAKVTGQFRTVHQQTPAQPGGDTWWAGYKDTDGSDWYQQTIVAAQSAVQQNLKRADEISSLLAQTEQNLEAQRRILSNDAMNEQSFLGDMKNTLNNALLTQVRIQQLQQEAINTINNLFKILFTPRQ